MAKLFKDKDKFFIDKFYYVLGWPFRMAVRGVKFVVSKIRQAIFKRNPEAEEKALIKQEKRTQKISNLAKAFVEKDKQIAARMIHAINKMDHRHDNIARKAEAAAEAGTEKWNLAREWAELNKKKLLTRFGMIVLILICLAGVVNLCTVYEYSYNGRRLGYVEDQDDVLRVCDIVSSKLTRQHGAEIAIDKEQDISFKQVLKFGKEVDDMEAVANRMTYMQDMVAHGTAILIDGERVAIVDSEETAQLILDSILATFAVERDNTKYEEVGFAENVTLETVDTRLGRLENNYDVIMKILNGGEEIKTHIVQSGETFSEIAKKYGITMADLQATNPLVNPARLGVGQEIVLTQAVPLLTVQTVEVSTLIEYMNYQTLYENNANIYLGETSVKVKGVPGEREVVAKIVKNNGVEVARLELQSTIIKDPVNQVLYTGTKPLPPKQGTGTFITPLSRYTLTSRFGYRWGSYHNAIDMAAPSGTKIRAADGGTVTYSGYSGSYGYLIQIDHGGGYETYYAHCSALYVSKGDKVYQGQHIANVGSTGYSTGPHLHFEVRYLGDPKNPLNYI